MNQSLDPPAETDFRLGRTNFSTRSVPPEQRHDYYRREVLKALDARDPEPGFTANITALRLGPHAFYVTETGGQTMFRTPEMIAADGLDHYIVQFQIAGSHTGDFDGKPFAFGPGEVGICDLSRPMLLHSTAVKVLTTFLPRADVKAVAPDIDLHGMVLDANRAGLLIEHLTAVTRWFPQLLPQTLPGITRATIALLGACLAMEAGRADFGMRESPVLARARAYVEHNLLEPSLNPARISEALGVSRSTLYRLFEPLGGVTAYIWERRLHLARAALLDPKRGRRISEIAFQCGFSSEAHFSRSFRKAFNIRPSDLRSLQPSLGEEPDTPFAKWTDAVRGT
ncbi:helix-turn-helix domain-containing protein [Caulobacter sp. BK020]|uniref:helix-turn-helix domain-containing protein n=1 Tax=Caulobacter sp. BK020 TaxID=2512117 RepID=UPI00104A4441|nr:helix-turn-helix domain-containing protein [Caulobacter sp. BK020]TCS13963.1 AraC-like DNA-binding protein [Caulobacter sp. BK020]